jgi:hypothetical protein
VEETGVEQEVRMPSSSSVLVVANVTAASPELIEALQARGPERRTLLMPCMGPGLLARDAARPRLDEALEAWRAAGLEAEGIVGDEDPLEAVIEVWDPRRYDEIVVSTLPGPDSRWMRCDLPSRLARKTDANVTHVHRAPSGTALRRTLTEERRRPVQAVAR